MFIIPVSSTIIRGDAYSRQEDIGLSVPSVVVGEIIIYIFCYRVIIYNIVYKNGYGSLLEFMKNLYYERVFKVLEELR